MAADSPVLTLPPELLSHVFSYLNAFDLECVAKTFNRQFYKSVIPTLGPLIPWVNNARRMCKVFPPFDTNDLFPSFPDQIPRFHPDWSNRHWNGIEGSTCERLGLDPSRGKYYRSSPPDLRSWMKLDGSFEWLAPLDGSVAGSMRPHTGSEGGRPVAEAWRVDAVVKQAKSLGLTLPVGYETFLRSNILHHRIPSSYAWYFDLSKLIECPPTFDNGAGGYLQRFHCDQQYCAFAYLYMNKSGNHCVLYSDDDVYQELGIQETEVEVDDNAPESGGGKRNVEAKGVFSKDNFEIVGLSFEEYLAGVYYEELLSFGAEPFPGLKDYVAHVYRHPAEIEPLRGQSKSESTHRTWFPTDANSRQSR
ncbi:hypothetical protein jhhlp_005411 [Lomentospora prolificans]|uniref:F-box domain-containing protein n=1 Tax=Lomentospora prolificans TaxID=41688 RepID=A0A2N3N6T5_9PEZI|nr:hypothetical protein jhhlp_005411 [Lomentospora prolificans]